MHHQSGGAARTALQHHGSRRFNRIRAWESGSPDLMRGCPVVTVDGEKIGAVEYLLIDKQTQQLRYVMLAAGDAGTTIAIPWQTLYFDAARAELVFYTAV